jgi:hypothetical protein
MRFLCVLTLSCLLSAPVAADVSGGRRSDRHLERVTGHYRIAKVEQIDKDNVSIRFEAESKMGKFNTLILKNDQVQLGLKEGQSFRLSAEVISNANEAQEITQVLLFMPSSEYGEVPVWLLSSQFGPQEIRGARMIEMHAPQSDYRIF